MDRFINVAFWTVTLFSCLQANPLPQEDSNIYYMRTNVICPSDSMFYAPTNVKEECIVTALDCVKKELEGPVTNECDDPKKYIRADVEYLHQLILSENGGHAPTNPSECDCHKWPQTPFKVFLEKTGNLLQLYDVAKSLKTRATSASQPLHQL